MKSTGKRILLGSYLVVVVFLTSCRQPVINPSASGDTADAETLQQELEDANKALNEREEKIINQYIKRHDLELTVSPTGLRYTVYRPGKGAAARTGDLVKFTYAVSLINGVQLESSAEGAVSELILEKGEAISGLHELLGKMNKGAKARAIIPSHLAYGFSGEQGRIPKGATLIYDIEVLEIIKSESL
ncbi:MAG TPA: FKBP-type peptidyl-prolyl cis-trans isomerase [Bacteroidales bacterium]|nr:FKBP-type peptidyl-prolyl cis-trans isomerase [Bacteroidales bacterium]HRZ49369.1 FKBP-type peptidyl-prolyl cis-trans isomerase [Bacteroidales bacterium]